MHVSLNAQLCPLRCPKVKKGNCKENEFEEDNLKVNIGHIITKYMCITKVGHFLMVSLQWEEKQIVQL